MPTAKKSPDPILPTSVPNAAVSVPLLHWKDVTDHRAGKLAAFIGARRRQLYDQSVGIRPSRQGAGVPEIVGIDVHGEDLPRRQEDAG